MHVFSPLQIARIRRALLGLFTLLAVMGTGGATRAAHAAATDGIYLPFIQKPGALVSSSRWVSAYYVGYQRDMLPPEEINWNTLTHLFVGRITPTASGGVTTNFDIDDVQGPQMARDLAQRAHAAGRKAVLMLGGAGEHDGFVGAASAQNRAIFVANLVRVMDDYGFDGIDVDWEPISDTDKPLLLALLQDLRAARPTMLLTIPVNWVSLNFPEQVDSYYVSVAALVDQLNIMTYDMSGNWDGWDSWYLGALYDATPTHPSSVESSVQRFLAVGIPASKLGIGVGAYGTCWRGVTQPRVPLAGSGASMLSSDNAMSYATIMSSYFQTSAYTFDAHAQVPYLSSSAGLGAQGCNFISYENADSIAAKGAYAKSQGLGGAIIWTIAQGHIASAPAGSRDPLMQAMQQAFLTP